MSISIAKRCALAATVLALICAAPAEADHKYKHYGSDDRYQEAYDDAPGAGYDYATVLRSIPVTDRVRISHPRQQCWTEDVPVPTESSSGSGSVTGTILGGIIGAAIGNAVGHHSTNKKVGVVAGGLLGASIGHDASQRRDVGTRYESQERCETVEDVGYEDQVVGYDVTYRYHGQTRTTRLDHDPGNSIRVRVDISPAE